MMPQEEGFLEFSSQGGCLRLAGQRFSLKGINWFGFETPLFVLHGLWQRGLADFLDLLAAQRFNALRIPLSAELALDLEGKTPGSLDEWANPALKGLSSGRVLDALVLEAGRRGLLVMFDMHHLTAAGGITELWYDGLVPEEKLCQAWACVVQRYRSSWNFFAADLKNEPHGAASWGTGDDKTDWRLAAERIGDRILSICPRLLIFVEGVSGNCRPHQTPEGCFWGGPYAPPTCSRSPSPSLTASFTPPTPTGRYRLLNSLHPFAPSSLPRAGVYLQDYFQGGCFPANMEGIWERQWGCAAKTGAAVVLGALLQQAPSSSS